MGSRPDKDRFGSYELLERLGDGGMAEIYRARRPGVEGFERVVVIKRMLPHLTWNKDVAAMFVAEAKLAARIHHKNIVPVHALEQTEDGEYFMVMEYVNGLDLRRLLRIAAEKNLRVPPWFTLHMMCEVLDGLAYVHELPDEEGNPCGVVHRDVTPSNVFISNLGEFKLGDFGVAKEISSESKTQPGQLKGKLSYMSPEQLQGGDVDQSTDVFAAGVMLWECLTQRRLFAGRTPYDTMNKIMRAKRKPPSRVAADVPSILDKLVLKTLEPNRKTRLGNARELQTHLLKILPRLKPSVNALEVRKLVDQMKKSSESSDGMPRLSEVTQSAGQHLAFDISSNPMGSSPELPSLGGEVVTQKQRSPTLSKGKGSDTALDLSFSVRDADTTIDSTVEHSVQGGLADDLFVEPSGDIDILDQPSWLIQGTDMNRHDSAFEPMDGRRWGEYKRYQARYDGSLPFFIKGRNGDPVGPVMWDDFLEITQSEVRLDAGTDVFASIDGDRWLPFEQFATLLGWESLVRNKEAPPPTTARPVGDLMMDPLLSLLYHLGIEQPEGRILFTNRRSTVLWRTEIHLSEGCVVNAYSDRVTLQMPESLREKGIIHARDLSAMYHQVLQYERPIEVLATEGTSVASGRLGMMLLKERIFDLARWSSGQVLVDTDAPVDVRAPIAESLPALLLELVSRMQDELQIDTVMAPGMKAKPKKTRNFEAALNHLRLNPAQRELAELVGKKKLSAVAKGRFAKSALVMAYLLYRVGALETA